VTGSSLTKIILEREPDASVWQAATALSEQIGQSSGSVCAETFEALASARHEDTISAISTCLLEHLLEHDFSIFDALEKGIRDGNDRWLFALSRCAKFGQSKLSSNSKRWDRLLDDHQVQLRAYAASVENNGGPLP